MTTLITGGTGLMGAGIAKRLVNRGEKPVLFDIYPAYWRIADIKDKVTVVRGNVTNLHEVLHVIKKNKVDKVIHLAFFRQGLGEGNFREGLGFWCFRAYNFDDKRFCFCFFYETGILSAGAVKNNDSIALLEAHYA